MSLEEGKVWEESSGREEEDIENTGISVGVKISKISFKLSGIITPNMIISGFSFEFFEYFTSISFSLVIFSV